jgi:hypothetical protein
MTINSFNLRSSELASETNKDAIFIKRNNRCVNDLLSFYITDEGLLQDTVIPLYLDAESDIKFSDTIEGA